MILEKLKVFSLPNIINDPAFLHLIEINEMPIKSNLNLISTEIMNQDNNEIFGSYRKNKEEIKNLDSLF